MALEKAEVGEADLARSEGGLMSRRIGAFLRSNVLGLIAIFIALS